MNRSIKNILAITTLTLTFAPALRCEDTQTHTASTSTLQSAINYIKNIRTPLTPQEKLAQHIALADIAGFKSSYDAFMQSDVTPEERATTLHALTITAQEVKQALQTELDTMGNKVKKTTLAKGVAQTVGGAISCIYHAAFSHVLYKSITLEETDFDNWAENSLSIELLLQTKGFENIFEAYWSVLYKVFGKDNVGDANASENTLNAIHTTYALAGIIASTYALKNGIQNCKNGWNYKAFVEQQIANIDEINTFIQEQLN